MSRARLRVGRDIIYTPTAVEAASFGPGPWTAQIAEVFEDGTVDLVVDVPDPASAGAPVADPLLTSASSAVTAAADAAALVVAPPPTPAGVGYVQAEATATADSIAELQATVGALVTLANDLKAKYNVAVTLLNETKADVNILATAMNTLLNAPPGGARRDAVPRGAGPGTYSFEAGPASV